MAGLAIRKNAAPNALTRGPRTPPPDALIAQEMTAAGIVTDSRTAIPIQTESQKPSHQLAQKADIRETRQPRRTLSLIENPPVLRQFRHDLTPRSRGPSPSMMAPPVGPVEASPPA